MDPIAEMRQDLDELRAAHDDMMREFPTLDDHGIMNLWEELYELTKNAPTCTHCGRSCGYTYNQRYVIRKQLIAIDIELAMTAIKKQIPACSCSDRQIGEH